MQLTDGTVTDHQGPNRGARLSPILLDHPELFACTERLHVRASQTPKPRLHGRFAMANRKTPLPHQSESIGRTRMPVTLQAKLPKYGSKH